MKKGERNSIKEKVKGGEGREDERVKMRKGKAERKKQKGNTQKETHKRKHTKGKPQKKKPQRKKQSFVAFIICACLYKNLNL